MHHRSIARSDLQEIDLATGELDFAAVADEVFRLFGPLAREKGVDLKRQVDAAPLWVEGDPDRLQQVLMVLLDNALKHTPSGGRVTILSRSRGTSACVEVVDTGKGIGPEHLPRVFDRFYRVDKARSREQGGLGMGLAIARSLVEAHHGELSLYSNEGAGTTARVCLHWKRKSAPRDQSTHITNQ